MRGQCSDGVLGQAHSFADFADGSAAAEVDDGRANPRAVPAVLLVNMLDDFFAPLVFEVDVDVRGFVTGFGHEALEDHGNRVGGDFGHPQRIADGGIGR